VGRQVCGGRGEYGRGQAPWGDEFGAAVVGVDRAGAPFVEAMAPVLEAGVAEAAVHLIKH